MRMENRSFTISSGVPAFLAKLWKLVDDPSSDHLISWSSDEASFIVHDQVTFSREILPKYFKHNNFASFVRQLNMYGFRKIVGTDQGGLKADKEDWQFQNVNFIRSQPRLLENVKRKSAPDDKKVKGEEYNRVLTDIHHIKDKQLDMSSKLDQVKMENQSLYQELIDLRQKHEEQEQVVNKLIRFLMKLLYSNNGLTNKRPLMIQGPESLNAKRPCSSGVNMDNPGPSQQQSSYSMRSPPRPTSMNVSAPSFPETSGPEITPVDNPEEYEHISISAVRPIINEPLSEDTYSSFVIFLQVIIRKATNNLDPSLTIHPQPCGVASFPAQHLRPQQWLPDKSTKQLQSHVQYIEDNLCSFQSILAGGNYSDAGMLDDLLESIVDGRDSPPNQGERDNDPYQTSHSPSHVTSPTSTTARLNHQPISSKHINWSVTSMLPEQQRDRSNARRY